MPPNKIDWNKISLEELLKNPLVFSFVCGIFALYFLILVWARRADRKDLEKVGLGLIMDSCGLCPEDISIQTILVAF